MDSEVYSNDHLDSLSIKEIACGSHHTVILTYSNELYGSGNNRYNQLGLRKDESQPTIHNFTRFPFGKRIRSIACSSDQTFIITQRDEIYICGGKNAPDDNIIEKWMQWEDKGKLIDKFVASCFTSCFVVISTDGDIFVSGSNSSNYGMLGVGSNIDCRGKLHQVFLPQIKNSKPKIVALGGQHSIIVTESNEFFCAGNNMNFQLGFQTSCGKQTHFVSPKNIPFAQKRIEQVCCGFDFTFVLVEGNILYGCGCSSSGQLGCGKYDMINFFTRIPFTQPIKQISCGEDYCIILTNNGIVYRSGGNKQGQLFLKSNSPVDRICKFEPCFIDYNIDKVVSGSKHTLMHKTILSPVQKQLNLIPSNCPFCDIVTITI